MPRTLTGKGDRHKCQRHLQEREIDIHAKVVCDGLLSLAEAALIEKLRHLIWGGYD